MNQQEAQKLLPLITAIAEGKRLQFKYAGEVKWTDLGDDPNLIPSQIEHYRVKPEPVKITRWLVQHVGTGCCWSIYDAYEEAQQARKNRSKPEEWVVVRLEGEYEA